MCLYPFPQMLGPQTAPLPPLRNLCMFLGKHCRVSIPRSPSLGSPHVVAMMAAHPSGYPSGTPFFHLEFQSATWYIFSSGDDSFLP